MSSSSDNWSGFVAVPENRSALQAARRIVRAIQIKKHLPFDVLCLHGPPGSGKSLLATKATNEITGSLILPASDFGRTEDDTPLTQFDLLVIEDLQRLKPKFSERLTWILDVRASHRRYTIVTSTSSPADLSNLPHRLTSRLIGGLVVHFGPLSLPSRVKLVRRFASDRQRAIPDEVAVQIAEQTPGGIRLLIGAVEDWIAAHWTNNGTIATSVNKVPSQSDDHFLDEILTKVTQAFDVTADEIRGPSRLLNIATARQVAILIGREQFKLKFRVIGRYLNRQGSSILEAGNYLRWKMVRDQQLTTKVNRLLEDCRELVRKLVAHESRV